MMEIYAKTFRKKWKRLVFIKKKKRFWQKTPLKFESLEEKKLNHLSSTPHNVYLCFAMELLFLKKTHPIKNTKTDLLSTLFLSPLANYPLALAFCMCVALFHFLANLFIFFFYPLLSYGGSTPFVMMLHHMARLQKENKKEILFMSLIFITCEP